MTRRLARTLVGGLLVLVAGCAETDPGLLVLNRSALRASKPRTLAIARAGAADFTAETSSAGLAGAAFGPLGGALADSASRGRGEDLIRDRRLSDPALGISTALEQALAGRFSLQVVPDSGVVAESSVEGLIAQFRGADLILDVRTSQWGFVPTSMGRYGATYDGTMRLIDTRAGKVIAEGFCAFHPVPIDSAPTSDELLANGAEALKQMLSSITEVCADDYRTRILGLYQ
jgi:hypothetical protein